MSSSLWFPFCRDISSSKVRLFCFSHAGGVASNFRSWQAIFSSHIEICPVQLPGRENRFKEPLLHSMTTLMDELWPHILSRLDMPAAFFGHSLGALISYELVKKSQKECKSIPTTLFISACLPPHCLKASVPIHQLPDQEFLYRMQGYGGMDKKLLDDPDALKVLLPRLRSDVILFETYQQQFFPLDIPLVIFGGRDDPSVPQKNLEEWKMYSTGLFATHMFLGGHFYHFTAAEELAKIIEKYLTSNTE